MEKFTSKASPAIVKIEGSFGMNHDPGIAKQEVITVEDSIKIKDEIMHNDHTSMNHDPGIAKQEVITVEDSIKIKDEIMHNDHTSMNHDPGIAKQEVITVEDSIRIKDEIMHNDHGTSSDARICEYTDCENIGNENTATNAYLLHKREWEKLTDISMVKRENLCETGEDYNNYTYSCENAPGSDTVCNPTNENSSILEISLESRNIYPSHDNTKEYGCHVKKEISSHTTNLEDNVKKENSTCAVSNEDNIKIDNSTCAVSNEDNIKIDNSTCAVSNEDNIKIDNSTCAISNEDNIKIDNSTCAVSNEDNIKIDNSTCAVSNEDNIKIDNSTCAVSNEENIKIDNSSCAVSNEDNIKIDNSTCAISIEGNVEIDNSSRHVTPQGDAVKSEISPHSTFVDVSLINEHSNHKSDVLQTENSTAVLAMEKVKQESSPVHRDYQGVRDSFKETVSLDELQCKIGPGETGPGLNSVNELDLSPSGDPIVEIDIASCAKDEATNPNSSTDISNQRNSAIIQPATAAENLSSIAIPTPEFQFQSHPPTDLSLETHQGPKHAHSHSCSKPEKSPPVQNEHTSPLRHYVTRTGATYVYVDGHSFRKDRVYVRHVWWRCIKRLCKSRCKTNSDFEKLLSQPTEHTHDIPANKRRNESHKSSFRNESRDPSGLRLGRNEPCDPFHQPNGSYVHRDPLHQQSRQNEPQNPLHKQSCRNEPCDPFHQLSCRNESCDPFHQPNGSYVHRDPLHQQSRRNEPQNPLHKQSCDPFHEPFSNEETHDPFDQPPCIDQSRNLFHKKHSCDVSCDPFHIPSCSSESCDPFHTPPCSSESHDPFHTPSCNGESHDPFHKPSPNGESHDPIHTPSCNGESHNPFDQPSPNGESHDPIHAPSPNGESHDPIHTPSPSGESHDPIHTPSPSGESHDPFHQPSPNGESHDPIHTPSCNGESHDPFHQPSPNGESHDPIHTPSSSGESHDPFHKPSPSDESGDPFHHQSSCNDEFCDSESEQNSTPLIQSYIARTGKPYLTVDGHSFRKDYDSARHTDWRCIKRSCKIRCKTSIDLKKLLFHSGQHMHDPPVIKASTKSKDFLFHQSPFSDTFSKPLRQPTACVDALLNPLPSFSTHETPYGNKKLHLDGYFYRLRRRNKDNIIWKCQFKGCDVVCRTDYNFGLMNAPARVHDHDKADIVEESKKSLRMTIKRKVAFNPDEWPEKIICQEIDKLKDIMVDRRDFRNFRKVVHRAKVALRQKLAKQASEETFE